MRVLHVNDYRTAGGCEALVASTMEALSACGVETSLFTAEDVPSHRRTVGGYIDSRRCRRALAARVESWRPDVVHLHNFYHELSPGILAELERCRARRRLRIVMTAHDHHLVCPSAGFVRFTRGRMMRCTSSIPIPWRTLLSARWDGRGRSYSSLKLLQHVWNYRLHRRHRAIDRVICPSRWLQRAIDSLGLPTTWLPNPLPPTADARDPARPRTRDRLELIFIGRLEPEKGLEEFIGSLPDDFDGKLTVVGGGSRRGDAEARAAECGVADRVEFLGPLPHARALERLASAHVLVLPSLCHENSPLVLLEALAAGTNVLTCDFSGMREIVEDAGVGFLFDPDEGHTLSAALGKIQDALARSDLNRFDGSAFLRERSMERYLDRLMELYESPPD